MKKIIILLIAALLLAVLPGCNGFLGLTLFERTGTIVPTEAGVNSAKMATSQIDPVITDLLLKILGSPEAIDALVKIFGDPGSIAAMKAEWPIEVKVKTTILKLNLGGGEKDQKPKENNKIEVKEK